MRVRHSVTNLGGDVEHTFSNEGAPYAGDLAGTWYVVRWDDGFRCAVHADNVNITDVDVTIALRFDVADIPEGVDPDAWADQLVRDALADSGRVMPR